MKIENLIQQTTFNSSLQKAMINLIYTYNWHIDQIADFLKPHGVTLQQFNVLRILRGKFPEFVPVGQVKEVMLDKNPDLTRLCDRLCEKGLMERKTNSCNRRQVLLCISDQGIQLLEELNPLIIERSKSAANLTEEEAETLSALLDKLRG
jgi:DNA-binding MarR family transcriptional regulator